MPPRALDALRTAWTATPWLPYAATLAFPVCYFLIVRLQTLSALLDMNATPTERTFSHKLAGLMLGTMQDGAVAMLMLLALLIVELVRVMMTKLLAWAVSTFHERTNATVWIRGLQIIGQAVRFAAVVVVTLLTLSFCTLDWMLVRAREIHFTTDLVTTYWREKDQGAGTLELEPAEVTMMIFTVVAMVVSAVVFAIGYVACVDLLRPWRRPRAQEVPSPGKRAASSSTNSDLEAASPSVQHDETQDDTAYVRVTETDVAVPTTALDSIVNDASPPEGSQCGRLSVRVRVALRSLLAISVYVALIAVTSAIAHAAHPVITAIALNASLNELLRGLVGVNFTHRVGSGTIDSAALYLQPETESFELFRDDVLYRKTTGFKGPLAFNVTVEPENPPNVLVLAVESFRYLDSLYLARNTTAGAVMQKHNLTVTPQFDRWAQRGVAFTNMWSSWQTSRSLEAILFGQVAYDSLPVSGTSRGRVDTKLVGMPQFFQQKGYETVYDRRQYVVRPVGHVSTEPRL